ncbi:pyruvate:ferredoxin (flavodoxin) oxidoreductase [Babesia caballi]|uniref:Pyruvate:ferredoxin (Flavodoxin) oxidoreductase n=1 Tax=Babesia caballi TaxID=5871 RepID=A0AAV4LZ81_BABCB|nr:pyruvate:ferredoxin (flavodoxin) oxidoreductase [Babesia caballi]
MPHQAPNQTHIELHLGAAVTDEVRVEAVHFQLLDLKAVVDRVARGADEPVHLMQAAPSLLQHLLHLADLVVHDDDEVAAQPPKALRVGLLLRWHDVSRSARDMAPADMVE